MKMIKMILCRMFYLTIMWAFSASAISGTFPPHFCKKDPKKLDLNDVSFLFPMPRHEADIDRMLKISDAGLNGAIVPTPILNKLEFGFGVRNIPQLRVVAARVDHCFRSTDGQCKKQIRLVTQPVVPAGFPFVDTMGNPAVTTEITAIDTAAHFLFTLSDAQFSELVTDLRHLKKRAGIETACVKLGVHPIMNREGPDGPYIAELKSIFAKFLGESTLDNVAIAQNFTGPGWFFQHHDKPFNTFTKIPITNSSVQQFFTDNGAFQIILAANPNNSVDLVGRLGKNFPSREEFNAAIDGTYKVENPMMSHTNNQDCASCHLSERVRKIATEDLMGACPLLWKSEYRNPRFNLEATPDKMDLFSIRMFGYMGITPAVSQRVVNESAEVAQALRN